MAPIPKASSFPPPDLAANTASGEHSNLTPCPPLNATPASFTPYTTLIAKTITSPPPLENAQAKPNAAVQDIAPVAFPAWATQHALSEADVPPKWRPIDEQKKSDMESLFFLFCLLAAVLSVLGFKFMERLWGSKTYTAPIGEDEDDEILCWDCITPVKRLNG